MSAYKPQYDGPVQGWVVNHMVKNYWRVERSMERDDVLQEAYLVYAKCAAHYPELDTPQHFMALFQRAWTNRFNDLSSNDTALRAECAERTVSAENDAVVEPAGDLDNDGYLATLIRQAPAEVKAVLKLFLNAPQELLDLALADWKLDRRLRTGGSKKICALLGLPQHVDVIKMTEDYLRR